MTPRNQHELVCLWSGSCQYLAPELVEGGYILPPKVVVKNALVKGRKVMYAEDADNLLETIDDNNIDKTLICARTTKQIVGLISQSDFCAELYQRNILMTITL